MRFDRGMISLWLKTLFAAAVVVLVSPAFAQSPNVEGGDRLIRVQIAPVRHTTLSAEIAGNISLLPLREGDRFETGDTVAQLDCTMHQARLSRAEAEAREARSTQVVNKRLEAMGAVSILELGVSAARQDAADAEVGLRRAVVERCTITAPFAGRVVEYLAREHQYVAEGQTIMEILDDSWLEIEMMLPSPWLAWLTLGRDFSVLIDETAESYPATVARIGARVDPVSQSVRVHGIITTANTKLMAGMSGVALFPR